MRYTYNWIDPSSRPPFRKRVRFTRGQFAGWTNPTGIARVHYAVFRNPASEILIPIYDLTPETMEKIGRPPIESAAS